MVAITKQEAQVIRELCPEAHIRRTMAQKSKRHHYFVSEDWSALVALGRMRGVHPSTLVRY